MLIDFANAVAVPFSTDPLYVDSQVEETAWQTADVIELQQQNPVVQGAHSYQTRVRVLRSPDALWLLVECDDPHPAAIAAHTLKHDAHDDEGNAFPGDDRVELVLDTYDDQHNAYYFAVNANSARAEGLINNSNAPALDWDAVWQAKTRRGERGWMVTMRMPWRIFTFNAAHKQWGFNIQRIIARDNMTLRWTGLTLDASLHDLARAGKLTDMQVQDQFYGVEFTPYGVAHGDTGAGEHYAYERNKAGADLSWRVTPSFTMQLTAHTDFSETEVDEPQLSVDRFELFVPEKRAFFLQSANQFTFANNIDDVFIPFFSRRIGLFNDHEVPIDWGVKASGRVDDLGVGILNVHTADTVDTRANDLSAARLTYDIAQHWRIGFVGTNGDPQGDKQNSLWGVDALYNTSELFGDKTASAAWWSVSSDNNESTNLHKQNDQSAWGMRLDYPNDEWFGLLNYSRFGDQFKPALGFLPRPDQQQWSGGLSYLPRPLSAPLNARQVGVEMYYTRWASLHNDTISDNWFLTPLWLETNDGIHAEINLIPTREVLTEPFEIARNVTIPAGDYRFERFRLLWRSSQAEQWRYGGEFYGGRFYQGCLQQWAPYLQWSNNDGAFSLRLRAQIDRAQLPVEWGGNFQQRLYDLRALWSFNADDNISAALLYDSEAGNEGWNITWHQTMSPGNELFVVWARRWQADLTQPFNRFALSSDDFSVKWRWTFWY